MENEKVYLVPAKSNSEWDFANAVVITITETDKESIRQAQSVLEKHPEFLSIRINAHDFDFYNLDEEIEEIQEVAADYEPTGEDDGRPEQRIEAGSFRVSRYSVSYTAYGKHTSEEFFTDDLSSII